MIKGRLQIKIYFRFSSNYVKTFNQEITILFYAPTVYEFCGFVINDAFFCQ